MSRLFFKNILVLAAFAAALPLSAQKDSLTNLPYSRFGLGDLQFKGFNENVGMAGLSQGYSQPNTININNPAALTSINLTTLQVGFNTNFDSYASTGAKGKTITSNLSYLALAFPLSSKMGFSVGLLPYSNVGYYSQSKEIGPQNDTVRYRYEGSGGINRFYMGAAYRLKDVNIGLNASYLFGNVYKTRLVDFPGQSPNTFGTRIQNRQNIKGLNLDLGIQYTYHLKKERQSIVVGATLSPSIPIKATNTETTDTYKESAGLIVPRDSLSKVSDQKGTLSFPAGFAGGIMFKSPKLKLGVDYEQKNWSGYRDFSSNTDYLKNSYSIICGAEYIPNPNAVFNYFKVLRYRAGARYGTSNLFLNGHQLMEKSVTFGLGIPIKRAATSINIAFEYGVRGTTSYDLIKETFVAAHLGFSFNDRWFIKRKID